jgi:hypothetical protein
MKRPRPSWARELEALRLMEARRLLGRLGESESLTLSRDEVIDLALSLAMDARGRKTGRRPSKVVLERNLAIAESYALASPAHKQAGKRRGIVGKLARKFHREETTVRRAIKAYATSPSVEGGKK